MVIAIVVQVLGKYVIIGSLDPVGEGGGLGCYNLRSGEWAYGLRFRAQVSN